MSRRSFSSKAEGYSTYSEQGGTHNKVLSRDHVVTWNGTHVVDGIPISHAGMRAKTATEKNIEAVVDVEEEDTPFRKTCRSRWAAMIKKVYEVDPLKCPKCGGQMRIISFIEAKDQMDVIENILKHCKLWVEPEERAPPKKPVTVPFESVHVPIDEFLANF